ncbi:unnamed protein product [Gongylonema pulchrum]|uniref:Type III secretion protein n=1 Tax=Gongylonema pulchrum TaxID=637853 RepID=A0A183DRS1_9BILA|nr:unnamed protein product [Gongylonema pulchrum]
MRGMLGLDTRWPVLWGECKLRTFPSEQFIRSLDVSQREQLASIITEVEVCVLLSFGSGRLEGWNLRLEGLMNHWHTAQMDPTPALLVDCRFLNKLSPQALSQTLCQLNYLASENRDRHRSWPLFYCNFDTSNENIAEEQNR